MSYCWRKARIAARLLLKREGERAWTRRDRELARRLAEDEGVTNRLIDQAVKSLKARRQNGYSILDIIA
jgi:pimeloyl-CoA synthetase